MKKFTKIASLFTAAAIGIGAMTACSGKDTERNIGGSDANAPAELTGTVSTDGSTSMEKVIGFLSEAYMEENPGVSVTYNPTGSGAGIMAVSEGRCDIGLSSRSLKEDEEKEGLTAQVVAIDGIAVVVNPENTVDDLTISQIAQIYTGEITDWAQVGGESGLIVPIGREAASGTRDGFESVTGTEDKCKYTQELTSTGDVIQTVSSNPAAIGYASLAAVKDTVKAVKVEGTAPTEETIQDGSYKLQRDFVMVTKKGASLSLQAEDFLKFALGGGADELIASAGAVPVKR